MSEHLPATCAPGVPSAAQQDSQRLASRSAYWQSMRLVSLPLDRRSTKPRQEEIRRSVHAGSRRGTMGRCPALTPNPFFGHFEEEKNGRGGRVALEHYDCICALGGARTTARDPAVQGQRARCSDPSGQSCNPYAAPAGREFSTFETLSRSATRQLGCGSTSAAERDFSAQYHVSCEWRIAHRDAARPSRQGVPDVVRLPSREPLPWCEFSRQGFPERRGGSAQLPSSA
jgi:hypothetical protein